MRVRGDGSWSGVGWHAIAVAAATVLAIGATACGDGDGGSSDRPASERPKFSAATEPPGTFAERMARLLETTTRKRDCPQLNEILARSLTSLSCPSDPALRTSMADFEIVGAEEYGTGAVVDYTSGDVKDGAALVLFSSPDRNWGVSRFGVVTKPSTDTSDAQSRAGFRNAIDGYLDAIQRRDCKAYMAVTFTDGRSRRDVCRTTFSATRALRARLNANPEAKPKYEGGNAVYGFFTLETSLPLPIKETISVVAATTKSASPYVILDSAPTATTDQQRAAMQQLKRAKTNPGPETSPSRKADSP